MAQSRCLLKKDPTPWAIKHTWIQLSAPAQLLTELCDRSCAILRIPFTLIECYIWMQHLSKPRLPGAPFPSHSTWEALIQVLGQWLSLRKSNKFLNPFKEGKKQIWAAENILSKFTAYFLEGSIPLSSEKKGFNAEAPLPHSGLGDICFSLLYAGNCGECLTFWCCF